jgi:pyruvate/2-oxoglutarate/acetoin dehydrogenase E1 component/TPP-dependent pyruvate/acetoin dehydrogenase alpha subunit
VIEARGAAVELGEAQLLELHELMVLGRALETRLGDTLRAGRLGGTLFPGIGQEAAMVGLTYGLEDGDVFAGSHRDLVAQLVRGLTVEQALLNAFGKAAAPTGGREGDARLGLPGDGLLMASTPAPGAVPVAVGHALAFRRRGLSRVVLADCGEGATSTGAWHEAVNLASVLELPVVFTVQNNRYAYSTPAGAQFRVDYAAHRADGYGIPGVVVDGNDVLACYAEAREAIDRAREGGGPSIVEAVTFRLHGHTGLDGAEYVDAEEREQWAAFDPIARFQEFLGSRGLLDERRRAELEGRIVRRIERSMSWAREQDDPAPAVSPGDLFAPHRASPPPPIDEGSEGTIADAISGTLGREMERDERVLLLGHDVGRLGGAHGISAGLLDRYGPGRVIDLPLGTAALIGAGMGAAVAGLRPVAEIQQSDFLYGGMDPLVHQLSRHYWKTGVPVPMVVRAASGAGVRAGPSGSLSPEGLLTHLPGIKVVAPATPAAAAGLLLTALRDPNPVVVLEHRRLYRSVRGPITDAEVPLGRARVARPGSEVTVVAWGAMVHAALDAAEELDGKVSVEVVDLQTLVPMDWETIYESVRSTSRLVVVQEDVPFASVASEVAARTAAEMFWDLDAPIVMVAPPHSHIPFASSLEDAFVPGTEDVVEAVRTLGET